MKEKIAVAMSGGVDSSFVAWLLKEKGYDIEGFTLKISDESDFKKSCCSNESLIRASKICEKLKIPHTVFHITTFFKKEVIDPFLRAYSSGLTPNPCIMCNSSVKFGYLLERVLDLGFARLATGHYARIKKISENRLSLFRARDLKKDQTYFLAGLTQNQLKKLLFPLGDFTKDKVIQKIKELDIFPFFSGESQDICFLGKEKKLKDFLKKNILYDKIQPGNFVDSEGKILGRHEGIAFYTVGQRKGLGISSTQPLYVKRINPERNEIILGKKGELLSRIFFVKNINFPSDRIESGFMKVSIRYKFKPVLCRLILLKDKRAKVELIGSRIEIPAGQWAVFYRNNRLVAGGEIEMP